VRCVKLKRWRYATALMDALSQHVGQPQKCDRRRRSFRRLRKTDNIGGKQNDDRERNNDADANHRAFCHCRRVARRDASRQRTIGLLLSMVRALWRRQLRGWRWRHVLLLHQLGPVQDDDVWHRRSLRRKPVLPWASDAAAAPFLGEATPSPAHLNDWSKEVGRPRTD